MDYKELDNLYEMVQMIHKNNQEEFKRINKRIAELISMEPKISVEIKHFSSEEWDQLKKQYPSLMKKAS